MTLIFKRYNTCLQEALERERLQLEEVVKLEIKGRMTAVEGLRGELSGSTSAMKERLKGEGGWTLYMF